MSFKDEFRQEVPALMALGGGLLAGGLEYLCFKHNIINLHISLSLGVATVIVVILLMRQ